MEKRDQLEKEKVLLKTFKSQIEREKEKYKSHLIIRGKHILTLSECTICIYF